MKLLNVIASMDPSTGGPCQGIRNLNTIDSTLGIQREVVSLDDPAAAFLGKDNFTIHALGPRKSPWQYASKLFPWLLENLPRFDAVIVNGIWLYHTFAVRKAIAQLASAKIKSGQPGFLLPRVFIMPHGMLDPYFQQTESRKLKALRNIAYWKWLEEKNIRQADGVFFTCALELQLARTTFSPYRPKKELNVSYGVRALPAPDATTKAAFAEKCPGLNDAPYLLFLSRIHQKKGVDLLVSAYIKLFEQLKLKGTASILPKLVIAGPGLETDYGQQLLATLAKSPEIASAVHFTGMLTGPAKTGAFWGSEAFILPSHQENFGIAVAEALSCSKPVLISDKINIYAEIKEAGAGFVAGDTVEGTLTLLTEWTSLNADQKKIMQRNAGNCFAANFAVEEAAGKMFATIMAEMNPGLTHSLA